MQDSPANISASEYPFSDAQVKIRRARKHFAELETEIRAFEESRPATFDVRIADRANGPQRVEINFHLDRLPPAEIGAIVGDIIHNLRSALDLMACDLVRLIEPEADVSNVYFPFCNHVDDLEKMIRRRNFHRAGPQAVALLLELKPYRGGNVFLRAIHDLDIQDKHKALIPTPMAVASPALRRWDDDGTPNLTIVGDPRSFSELTLFFPPDSPLAGVKVLEGVKSLVELAAGIIESFRALSDK